LTTSTSKVEVEVEVATENDLRGGLDVDLRRGDLDHDIGSRSRQGGDGNRGGAATIT
jgi:hypothetical protein